MRIEVAQSTVYKQGDLRVGHRCRAKIQKNKVAAPFKQTEFEILYGEGISREGELLALGESLGVIHKSGSSYSYGEEKLGRGYDASRTSLRENKKMANEILKEIKKRLAEAGIAGSKVTGNDAEETE